MASQTQTDDGLATTYETHLGDSSTRSEARGYGMVALGAILGILGMGLLLTNQSAGGVRELAVVLASTGLLLLFAGPVVRLPLERTATYIVAVGMAIATVAIVWFVAAYPGQWSTQTVDILPALKREDSSVGGSATDPRRQLAGLCALLWDFREGVVSPTSRGRPTRIARAVPSA